MASKEEKPTFIKYCCFSLSSKSRRVNHPVVSHREQTPSPEHKLRWRDKAQSCPKRKCGHIHAPAPANPFSFSFATGKNAEPRVFDLPTVLRHLPQGWNKMPITPDSSERSKQEKPLTSHSTASQRDRGRSAVHPLVYGVCHLSYEEPMGRREKIPRAPGQWDPVKSGQGWRKTSTQSLTSGLHICTYTHTFGCAYTYTHAKQISI